MDNQYLKNIKKGIRVEILTNNNHVYKGIVEDIGSGSNFSEKGILVRLKTGEIGRVQKILDNKSDSERDLSKKVDLFRSSSSNPEKTKRFDDIESWIKSGENFNLEFKSNALWSINFSEEQIRQSKSYDLHLYKQKASKVIIAKSIAAMLNSEGGNLLIGIRERKGERDLSKKVASVNGGLKDELFHSSSPNPEKRKGFGDFEIVGIEEDLRKLKDNTKDGYKRMIIDDIIRPFFPPKIYNHLNNYVIIGFIDINNRTICNIKIKRSEQKVFLKIHDREIFMIRIEAENRSLEGEKLVDYCLKHFKN